MKTNHAPIVTILAAVLLGTSGVEAAEAGVQRLAAPKENEAIAGLTMEEYEKTSAMFGKMVREFKFPTSEPEEFANVIAWHDSNPAEAEKRYKLTICRGVGFVRQIGEDSTWPTRVTVVGRIEDVKQTGDETVVECCFTKSEADAVAKLKPSDRVIIRGLCIGKRSNLVGLFGCHIESVQSPGQNNLMQKDDAPGDGVEHAADGTETVRQKQRSAAVRKAEAISGLTIEEYEEKSAILGKRVREFKFPTSEPEEFTNVIAWHDSNPAEAERRYKTKMCRGVGFVRQISKDMTGPTRVTVVGRIEDVTRTGDGTVVECCFTKSEAEAVAKLKPSDRVIIRGICFGKASNLVGLYGCHIDDVQSPGQDAMMMKDDAPGDGVEHAADRTETVRQKSRTRRMTDD